MRSSSSISARSSRRRRAAELREQLVDLVQIGLRRPLRRQPRGLGLEHRAHLAEPREVAHVDGRDEDPAPRIDLDEPLLREPAQRLAHRRAADAEPRRQLRLVAPRSRAAARARRSARGARSTPGPQATRPRRAAGPGAERSLPEPRRYISRILRADPVVGDEEDECWIRRCPRLSRSRRRQRCARSPRSPRQPGSSPTRSIPYGRYKAKVSLSVLDRLASNGPTAS